MCSSLGETGCDSTCKWEGLLGSLGEKGTRRSAANRQGHIWRQCMGSRKAQAETVMQAEGDVCWNKWELAKGKDRPAAMQVKGLECCDICVHGELVQ